VLTPTGFGWKIGSKEGCSDATPDEQTNGTWNLTIGVGSITGLMVRTPLGSTRGSTGLMGAGKISAGLIDVVRMVEAPTL
jgi:hypothetical protein